METVRYIDADLHSAATEGKIHPFKDYPEPLDRLLTPNKNTILHIHLTCPKERSKYFIKEVLKMCRQLLVRVNVEGNTPLHVAVMYGHSNAAKLLIEQATALLDKDLESGEVDALSAVRQMLRITNKNKETALHIAARLKNLEVVKVILDNEDPKFTYSANSNGESPLYLVANLSFHSHMVVAILSTFKSSVNFGGPGGKTALHAAISRNRFVNEILQARSSLAIGADENGWTPLHYAVCRDDFSSVQMLLDADKSAAYVADKERKMTALHMAAYRGHKIIVREIISRSPDCCELVDVNGRNVLHYAVISQRFEVLEAALKSSSFTYHLLDMKDNKGYTPIDFISVSVCMEASVHVRKEEAMLFANSERDAFLFHIVRELYSIRFLKRTDSEKKEMLEWMEDVGTGPYGKIVPEEDWNTYSHMETVRYIDAELHHAAAKGKIDPFKNDPELDRLLTPNKNTILHIHLTCPKERSEYFIKEVLEMCRQLLVRKNVEGNTPLHLAVMYGHSNAAKLLIEQAKTLLDNDLESGEVDALSIVRQMLRMTNKNKETALHIAARLKNLEVVKVILDNEEPEFTYSANSYGESPFYLAANSSIDNRMIVAILNTFKLSVDFGGPGGKTALHAAISRNRFVHEILAARNNLASKADENGWTPLHYAVCQDDFSSVKMLLDADESAAYVADKDRKMTALHVAACRGNKRIVSEIISKCPNCCELVDVKGWNVLHYAVISQRFEVLEAAFKSSSFTDHLLDMKDLKGYTPVDFISVSSMCDSVNRFVLAERKDAFVFHIFHNIWYRDSDSKKEILKWMEDVGNGPYGKLVPYEKIEESWKEKLKRQLSLKEPKGNVSSEFEKAKDSHLVAATLVATVTFAAAFTLPGGYISDENNLEKGTPILSRNAAFKAFVISDAIAMVLSTSSVFMHFIMVMPGNQTQHFRLMQSVLWFNMLAMAAMVVAFVTGTYAVLAAPSRWLAITTIVIGLGFFIYVFYTTIRLVVESVRHDREKNGYKPIFQSLHRIWRQSPFHFSIFHKDRRVNASYRPFWWKLKPKVIEFLHRFK